MPAYGGMAYGGMVAPAVAYGGMVPMFGGRFGRRFNRVQDDNIVQDDEKFDDDQ
jgi:hypothetical protein